MHCLNTTMLEASPASERSFTPRHLKNSAVQAKALDTVMSDLNTRFGKGSIMKMGATPQAVYAFTSGASSARTWGCVLIKLCYTGSAYQQGRSH